PGFQAMVKSSSNILSTRGGPFMSGRLDRRTPSYSTSHAVPPADAGRWQRAELNTANEHSAGPVGFVREEGIKIGQSRAVDDARLLGRAGPRCCQDECVTILIDIDGPDAYSAAEVRTVGHETGQERIV